MTEDCPDCGHDLVDVADTLRQNLAAEKEESEDVLKSVNEILGYYCSDCSDFYRPDELNTHV
jgi:hypothetical protein